MKSVIISVWDGKNNLDLVQNLYMSAFKYDHDIEIFVNENYQNNFTSKICFLHENFSKIDEKYDIIIYADSFDCIVNDYPSNVINSFLERECQILFGSENFCTIDENKKLLNAGVFIGFRNYIYQCLGNLRSKKDFYNMSDQHAWRDLLPTDDNIKIDLENSLICNCFYHLELDYNQDRIREFKSDKIPGILHYPELKNRPEYKFAVNKVLHDSKFHIDYQDPEFSIYRLGPSLPESDFGFKFFVSSEQDEKFLFIDQRMMSIIEKFNCNLASFYNIDNEMFCKITIKNNQLTVYNLRNDQSTTLDMEDFLIANVEYKLINNEYLIKILLNIDNNRHNIFIRSGD